jgi:dCMP deaminase
MIKVINEGEFGTRPSWDEYFMSLAILTASRTSCRHVESGTLIVQEKQILGMGYNGAPFCLENCLDVGCRKEQKGLKYRESLNTGTCVAVHSEMNAVRYVTRRDFGNIELYNTIFPCHDCADNLLPYGLTKLVFKSFYDNRESESTLELLAESGVEVYRLNLSPERYLDILFNRIIKREFTVWSPEEGERMKPLLDKLREAC